MLSFRLSDHVSLVLVHRFPVLRDVARGRTYVSCSSAAGGYDFAGLLDRMGFATAGDGIVIGTINWASVARGRGRTDVACATAAGGLLVVEDR